MRHKTILAKNLREYEYTCGSHLFPPDENRKLALALILKPNLQCVMEVEVLYYASDIGRPDICSHCGTEDAIINMEIKKEVQDCPTHMRCLCVGR